jgi:hypothetical protein
MIRPDYVAFLQARQSLSSIKKRLVVNKEKVGRQQRKGWSPKKKRPGEPGLDHAEREEDLLGRQRSWRI